MKLDKNNNLKGMLPSYEASPEIWQNIEKVLDNKPRRKAVFWYWTTGIAAGLLVLLWFGGRSLLQDINVGVDTAVETVVEPPIASPESVVIVADSTNEDSVKDIQESVALNTELLGSTADGDSVVVLYDAFANATNQGVLQNLYKTDLKLSYTAPRNYINTTAVSSGAIAYQWDFGDIQNGAGSSSASGVDEIFLNYNPDVDFKSNQGAYSYTPVNNSKDILGGETGYFSRDKLIKGEINALRNNDDADGVANYFDNEVSDVKVNLDIDKDGIHDALDPDPYRNANFDSIVITSQKPIGDYSTEYYAPLIENEYVLPTDDALSTFAIDVDNAAYAIMRSKLNNNEYVPKNSVRIEEYINYFSYQYEKPNQDAPFSINTEMAQCPWNKEHQLVHIGLQGKQIDYNDKKSSNLVFLLDVSGSMDEENKLPLVKKSMNLLVDQMGANDRIAIVTYAGAAGLALESTSCSKKEYIRKKIKKLDAGGSTAGGEGIKLAYKVALENLIADGNNRIILCTDGDFNVGQSSDADMKTLIQSYRDKGVFITVCGYGMGNLQDSKMETIADNGNGNYFYIDTYKESEKVFNRELTATLFTIAKDVKIQVEFNPAYVKAYRLIGYENRIMPDVDFNDDTKDGGELGAGHTVTALYEIVPAGSSEIINKVIPLKYQKTTNKNNMVFNGEAVNVKLRYKKPNGTKSFLLEEPVKFAKGSYTSASQNFKFSAGVALYASTLRGSKFTEDYEFELAAELVEGSLGRDKDGDRKELLSLIRKSQNLYTLSTER